MPNVTGDFLPRKKYLLSAHIFQTFSKIQGFRGEHPQHLRRGYGGKASAFSPRQQSKRQWEHVQWAGGGENLCIPQRSGKSRISATFFHRIALVVTSLALSSEHFPPTLGCTMSSFFYAHVFFMSLTVTWLFSLAPPPILSPVIHFPNVVESAMFFSFILYDTAAFDLCKQHLPRCLMWFVTCVYTALQTEHRDTKE